MVQVFYFSELSSDHCPILVHVATRHSIARVERRITDWDCYGPALCRRLPDAVPFDTIHHDETVVLFDEAVVFAVDVYSHMKPGLMPNYQHIPEETSLLVQEKIILEGADRGHVPRWTRRRSIGRQASYVVTCMPSDDVAGSYQWLRWVMTAMAMRLGGSLAL